MLPLNQFLSGQVVLSDADEIVPVSYPSYTGEDYVFVYFSHPGENILGSIEISHRESGEFDFSWSAFDTTLLEWGDVFKTETAGSSSSAEDLEEGGYRITVSQEGIEDTVYYAWVFIDNLVVDVEETTEEKIKNYKYGCDFLILNGFLTIDEFSYYDPVSFEKITLNNGAEFEWTSDNEDIKIPNASRVLNPNTTYSPPVEDTWYILTAVDSFGMTDVDSVFYETISVKADFSFEFYDKAETEDYIEAPTPTEDDAPLKVRFINESVNGYSFEWIFTDSTEDVIVENEFTEDLNYQPEYLYKIPDDYYPSLVATSEENCVDTLKLEEPITVLPSELEAPNVFSPEGLEVNRYFKVKFKSIKEFHIRIYSRTGNLVYKKDVNDLYSWDGWDGNIMNSSRPAPPGAYYYVIEATGWDEVRYNKGPYKGVVYLFRGKN